MAGFRATLTDLGFTEIQTPKLVASATEGGANVFGVKYFDRQAYLAQSPQFYKQIMVGVFERVFEVGPVFRAEPHDTVRHINEYVSLDVEMGFIRDHRDVMAVLTKVIRGILAHLEGALRAGAGAAQRQAARRARPVPVDLLPRGAGADPARSGARTAAASRTSRRSTSAGWASGRSKSTARDFLFVTGYPMGKRPFYTHPNPADPRFSNSFDLLFRGTELVTGGQRLHLYQDYLDSAARARLH